METKPNENQYINKNGDIDMEIILDMFDKFLQMYNFKHNTTGSMFDGINTKDPLSVNDKLEVFYQYVSEYKYLKNINQKYTDVYHAGDIICNDINFDVYALIANKTTVYISLSYISLLITGINNKEKVGDNWNIVKL